MSNAGPDLFGFLSRVAEGAPTKRLLEQIVDSVRDAVGAERVFVFRFRPGGGFRVVLARDVDGLAVSRPSTRMSHHAVRQMEVAGEAWLVEEARVDRRYRTEDSATGGRPPRSILVVPLRSEEELVGGIYADHRFQRLRRSALGRRETLAWTDLLAITLATRDLGARLRLAERRRHRHLRIETSAPRSEVAARRASGAGSPEREESADREGPADASPEPVPGEDFHGFWSANPDLRDAFDALRGLARTDLPVLIRGETGTGKSLLARAIHLASGRAEAPFVTLGCGGTPEGLLESELLGHVRGAFTGAESDREGVVVESDGGTLFLDHLGDLSLDAQTKLLRILEERSVRPLGGKDSRRVDFRVICATSDDLERRASEGTFRSDLLYRVRGHTVQIPPLRERREDIHALASAFLERQRTGAGVPRFSRRALDVMLRYPWPGNVRELENEMRRLAALGGDEVRLEALSPAVRREPSSGEGVARSATLGEVVARAEAEAIRAALRRCGGNKSRTAMELGVTRKALYRRLAKYSLEEAER